MTSEDISSKFSGCHSQWDGVKTGDIISLYLSSITICSVMSMDNDPVLSICVYRSINFHMSRKQSFAIHALSQANLGHIKLPWVQQYGTLFYECIMLDLPELRELLLFTDAV